MMGARHRDGQPVSIVQVHGITVYIDRHHGTVINGTDPDGQPYSIVQKVDYGFMPGIMGDDGEPYDVYLGTAPSPERVFIITQNRAGTTEYDEQKAMLGYDSAEAAEQSYRDHTHPSMFAAIASLTLESFKAQVAGYDPASGPFHPVTDASAEDAEKSGEHPMPEVPHEDGRADAETTETSEARIQGGEPAGSRGRESDAPSDGMHVRQAVVRAVRPEAREVDLIASTEAVDSHRSILRANWDLKRFLANPVLLWMHGRMNDHPPVGSVRGMAVTKKVLGGTAVFDDTTQFDRDVWKKYEKRVLRGFSVGFCPGRVLIEEIDGEEILVFDDNELLELSCANVPSNPEVLARAQAALMDRARLVAHAARVATARGPVPYHAFPPAETDSWDAAVVEKRVRAWATRGDGSIDWGRYGSAFGWTDPENRENFSAHKLLHHDVRDGKLVTDRAGTQAAGNVLSGGRGGVKIPDADMPPTRAHIAKHYQQFGLTPPWEDKATNKAARRGRHGETMEIKTTDVATDIRAAEGGGMACRTTCPHCNEIFELGVRTLPTDPRAIADLTEARTQTAAAEARATGLQAMVGDMTRQLVEADMTGAHRDLTALLGTKVFPTELDHELALARSWLSDRSVDKNDAKQRTVGQIRWEEHLTVIRSRPDLKVISSGSALPADTNPPKPPAVEETRTSEGKKVTSAGSEAVALIDARA